MKKLSLLVAATAFLFTFQSQAQLAVPVSGGVPQAFPYSSQVRDDEGNLLSNRFISLRISMHSGSATGPVTYVEHDTTTTSPNGIFSVVVGGGTIIQGKFDSIPWTSGQIYQQVELDENGGTNFSDMGTAQLLSFPYAIAAGNGVADVKYDQTGKLSVTSADGSTDIKSDAASWMTTGNSEVGSAGFLGTTDNTDLVFKRNGSEGLRLKAGDALTMPGKLGIGVAEPLTSLDVNGGLTLRDTTVNITASGAFNLSVGNHALVFINSSVYASYASAILSPGLAKGQVVMLAITGSNSSYGVRFYNHPNYNTRINIYGQGVGSGIGYSKNYTEGNTLTLLWNGSDWVQIASSISQ